MNRRIPRRTVSVLAAGALAAVAGLLPALPALAHGAPIQPISRTAACAPGEGGGKGVACRAAAKANGGPFGTFDNLRVPGVNGRDRQVIPDGKLCSGGLADFKGLDLPRTDWPASTLTAGGALTIRYRTTIPHAGSFRVYLTKQGWDPSRPLRWKDLDGTAVLTVKDPPLSGGSYKIRGTLPKDRTGRHLLYTIWQTTSTPDTYYSCSDLVIKPAAGKAAGPAPKSSGTPKAHRSAAAAPPAGSDPAAGGSAGASTAGASTARGPDLTRTAADGRATLGRWIVFIALVAVAAIAGTVAVRRIRRSPGGRSPGQQIHR